MKLMMKINCEKWKFIFKESLVISLPMLMSIAVNCIFNTSFAKAIIVFPIMSLIIYTMAFIVLCCCVHFGPTPEFKLNTTIEYDSDLRKLYVLHNCDSSWYPERYKESVKFKNFKNMKYWDLEKFLKMTSGITIRRAKFLMSDRFDINITINVEELNPEVKNYLKLKYQK